MAAVKSVYGPNAGAVYVVGPTGPNLMSLRRVNVISLSFPGTKLPGSGAIAGCATHLLVNPLGSYCSPQLRFSQNRQCESGNSFNQVIYHCMRKAREQELVTLGNPTLSIYPVDIRD